MPRTLPTQNLRLTVSETSGSRSTTVPDLAQFKYLKCDGHVLPQPQFGKNQRVTKKILFIAQKAYRPEKQLHVADMGKQRWRGLLFTQLQAKRLFC